MKRIFYIPLIVLAASCKNNVQRQLPAQNVSVTDTVATAVAHQLKYDTIVRVSKPFELNHLMCYWTHYIISDDFTNEDYPFAFLTMKLKEYKTERTLWEIEEYSTRFPENYPFKSHAYFDTINKRHLDDDFNFDGFKDIGIYYAGSMGMTSATALYLFNNKTKTFDYAEDLSDNAIEKIDPENKTLETSSWNLYYQYERKHHFGKNGKLLYSEQFTTPTDTAGIVRYQKTIDGKVVEQRTDTKRNDE